MAELNDIGSITIGGQSISAAYIVGDMIWPRSIAYIYTLTPTWTSAYALTSIPASGGSASAVWTLTITTSGGTVVYSEPVTPTSVNIYEQDSQQSWVMAENFHYSGGVWSADDRARNGITSSSGSTVPQSAPARTCKLTASYTFTYAGASRTATAEDYMTQNANNAYAGAATATNPRIYLSKYNSNTDSGAAPASRSTDAAVSAYLDRETPYTFDSGPAYNYTLYERDAIGTANFNFTSSQSWVTFGSISDGRRQVIVASRGTDGGTDRRSATITATYAAQSSLYAQTTLYQQKNPVTNTAYRNVTLSALASSPSPLVCTTTQFTVSGTLAGEKKETFASGDSGNWTSFSNTVAPTVTSAQGARSYSGSTVYINANSDDTTKTIAVGAKYNLGGTDYTASKTFTQGAVTYTYANPVVTITYPVVAGQSYHIGAASGYVIPTVSFTQQRTNDVSHATSSVTGTYTYGSDTSRQASDGSTFTISFSGSTSISGASVNTGSGRVDAPSRYKTTGGERNITTNAKASITSHSKTNSSSSFTVKQRANSATPVDASCSSVVISSLSPSSITNTCAATTVTATVKATWTDAGTKYTAYDDGDTSAKDGMAAHNNVSVTGSDGVTLYVNGSPVTSSTNQFSVNKVHSESTADHTVYANFMSVNSATSTIYQKPDAKSNWQTRNWTATVSIGNNQIWAGGGTAAISAYGSHIRYKTWTDGAEVDTETINTDTPTLSLVNANNDNAYTGTAYSIVGSQLHHRDMENNGTTDSVRVKATNSSASAYTSTVSITNNRQSSPGGYSAWHDYGSSYAGNYAVDTFTAGAYTSSGNPAPRTRTTTTYNVTASHDTLIAQAKDAYYYYDSNFASEHGGSTDYNDAAHRDTVANADTSGTPRVISHHTGDGVTFSYPTGQTWLTAASGTITIAAQSQLGDGPRDGYVFATNAGGGNPKNVRLYQAPYAGFSVSQTSFSFPAEGGTYSTTVTSYYAAWDIHYTPRSTDPGVIFTAAGSSSGTASGGNDNEVTTTTVTLTVAAYAQSGEPTQGEASLDARTRTDAASVTITLRQVAPQNI